MPRPPVVRTGGVGVQGSPIRTGFGQAPSFAPVTFDRDAFDAQIRDHGENLLWERAAHCPNRPGTIAPRAHDISCTICDGSGWVFFGASPQQMLIQSVRVNQNFFSQGEWTVGSVMVTARPGVAISYWDRLTMTDAFGRFTELVRRQSDGSDALKYSACSIEYAAYVDRSGALVSFNVGSDLDVDANGGVSWSSGPDPGCYYTISYRYHPRYVVQDLPHRHRDEVDVGGEIRAFPVQAVAKLDFLVRDESKDRPEVVGNAAFGLR